MNKYLDTNKILKQINFLHYITFLDNIKSIKLNGLVLGKESFKFGDTPKLNGIYLFHKNNKDIIKDFKKTFPFKKLFLIKVDISKLDFNSFCADEDYYKYHKPKRLPYPKDLEIYKQNFLKSLEEQGTAIYLDNIDKKYLKSYKKV